MQSSNSSSIQASGSESIGIGKTSRSTMAAPEAQIQKKSKKQMISAVLLAAGEAFGKLGELVMELHPEEELLKAGNLSVSSGTRWSEDEVKRLHEAMAKFNNDLAKISEAVRTRSIAQVRTKMRKDANAAAAAAAAAASPQPPSASTGQVTSGGSVTTPTGLSRDVTAASAKPANRSLSTSTSLAPPRKTSTAHTAGSDAFVPFTTSGRITPIDFTPSVGPAVAALLGSSPVPSPASSSSTTTSIASHPPAPATGNEQSLAEHIAAAAAVSAHSVPVPADSSVASHPPAPAMGSQQSLAEHIDAAVAASPRGPLPLPADSTASSLHLPMPIGSLSSATGESSLSIPPGQASQMILDPAADLTLSSVLSMNIPSPSSVVNPIASSSSSSGLASSLGGDSGLEPMPMSLAEATGFSNLLSNIGDMSVLSDVPSLLSTTTNIPLLPTVLPPMQMHSGSAMSPSTMIEPMPKQPQLDTSALQILPNTTDITTDSALVGASSVSASVESSLPTVTE